MILILAAYIALLSVAVKMFSGDKRHRWNQSGYFTAFLLPFLIYVVFLNIIGPMVGSGIGVAFIGLIFGIATLIIGYTSKAVHDS
ncbi:hypothetical protein [Planococcus sp. ISL-109]|uniref:hypothetical protein n=1 Tax=Planococcus sp. ISL-109 TaxID=2819166 RepID=UPI001BE71201|nr:hypothetical protein [Planococcus sp. ISL-109]MBT2583291.1 hypothetical protein [Planococcus sp. ISL-109]